MNDHWKTHAVNKTSKPEPSNNGYDNPAFLSDETVAQKKKNAKSEKEKKMVGFFQLFSFADSLDILLMLVGIITAAAVGIGQPAVIIVFGQIANSFVASGQNVSTGRNNSECPAGATGVEAQMTMFAYYYVGFGFGVLLLSTIQVWTFLTSAARQTARIRDKFFFAVLHQEMAWFDTIQIGTLNTRLTDDINTIQEGIGDKISLIVQFSSTFVAGIVIGFVHGWKLTLVILAVSPLLVLSGAVWSYILSRLTTKELAAYAKAGAVAEEILSAIRTVTSFNGQKKATARYDANLEEARIVGMKKAIVTNASLGITKFLIYACHALAFWYGTKLVEDEPKTYNIGEVLTVFFSVLVGVFAIGHVSPNLESLANARGAAYEVYKIINKVFIGQDTSYAFGTLQKQYAYLKEMEQSLDNSGYSGHLETHS